MRIKLFAAARDSRRRLARNPLSRKRFRHRARADLCRPRRPRRRRAGRRPCPGRAAPSGSTPSWRPNVPAGHRRFLVEADVVALIRGAGGLPARVSYLVDLPNDSRGRPAQLAAAQRMAAARARACRIARPSCGWPRPTRRSPTRRRRPSGCARSCARRAAADAPPRITGIGRAFHVPGSLPGESETQIFLQTADERPISLTVLRRPGEQPRWAVRSVRDRRRGGRAAGARHPALVPARLHPAARACRGEPARGERRRGARRSRPITGVVDRKALGPCARHTARASAARKLTSARRRRRRNRDRCRACGSRRAAR